MSAYIVRKLAAIDYLVVTKNYNLKKTASCFCPGFESRQYEKKYE